jgi:hypothetical protein
MPPITVSRVATTLFSISLAAWEVARTRTKACHTPERGEKNRAVATYVRAFAGDGVDLVDEHQCGSVVGRLLEQVADL